MHRGAPAFWLDDAKIHLQIVLHAHGCFRSALRENLLDKWHTEKRLHRLLDISRRREDVHVVNDFLHAAQAAAIRHALCRAFQVFAQLRGDRNRPPEQVIPFSPAIELDTAQNIVDALLLEARNGEQLVGLA